MHVCNTNLRCMQHARPRLVHMHLLMVPLLFLFGHLFYLPGKVLRSDVSASGSHLLLPPTLPSPTAAMTASSSNKLTWSTIAVDRRVMTSGCSPSGGAVAISRNLLARKLRIQAPRVSVKMFLYHVTISYAMQLLNAIMLHALPHY